MSRNRSIVEYELDTGNIKFLHPDEIKAILRAADGLIGQGGRSMLTKILKGSKDKKLLNHGLNNCPFYGFYNNLPLHEISNRIDWTIKNGYIQIGYSGKLPVLYYSPLGWEIERETYAEELFQKLSKLLDEEDFSYVLELIDKDRGLILLLIEKIRNAQNPKFIPFLEVWKEIDYKKVSAELQKVINRLNAT